MLCQGQLYSALFLTRGQYFSPGGDKTWGGGGGGRDQRVAVRFEGGNDILTWVSTKEIIVVPVLQWKRLVTPIPYGN